MPVFRCSGAGSGSSPGHHHVYRHYASSSQEVEVFFATECSSVDCSKQSLRNGIASQIEHLYGLNDQPIYLDVSFGTLSTAESDQIPEETGIDLCGTGCYELFTLKGSDSHGLAKVCTNPSGDTSSDASIHWIRDQVNECNKLHDRCKQATLTSPQESMASSDPNKDQFLPGRILDISCFEDINPNAFGSIKVIPASVKTTPYVCLSHCWGKTKDYSPPSTTTRTLAEFQESIPFANLPQTYKDAILFTHQLGLSYLWIDSLCIIQDSRDDWVIEAGKMAGVFANCYVALCASKSRDGRGGLFQKSTIQEKTHRIALRDGTSVFIRPKIRHPDVTAFEGLEPDRKEFPLLDRGWVVQEVLLAPRLIHFGEELVWECIHSKSCECSSVHFSSEKGLYILDKHPRNCIGLWHQLVTRFSALNLSVPTDRLPAMSGLAKKMQKFRRGKYLAGLWESAIVYDLLWFCEAALNEGLSAAGLSSSAMDSNHAQGSNLGCPGSPSKKIFLEAPSWSWAKVKGKVAWTYNIGSDDQECKLLEAHCSPVDQDVYGEVRSGWLRLEGYLIPGKIEKGPWSKNGLIFSGTKDQAGHNGLALRVALDASPQELGPSLHFLVLVGEYEATITYEGIILQCLDAEKQVYQRVGWANGSFDLPEAKVVVTVV